ncbi:MAG TPA: galactose-1-phosphate uridylyltransferase [Candidatus Methylomirabilis sp.]|nr:galactose-1-phosphate uridylyltransferase [Candidatus Methylomirabilis sp.]
MKDSRLRKDPVTQHWVVISPGRAEVPMPGWPPQPAGLPPEACPFCPGREDKTGKEIHAEREPGSSRNGPGWWVRVVADKYPILHIEGGLERSAEGMYDSMNAIGAHEILIETPVHEQHWATLETLQMERVLRAVQQRSVDLRNDSRFRHVFWVKNHGLATSLFHHQHSHILASPFVPRAIDQELKGFGEYARWKERCVLCDVVKQELRDGRRILLGEGAIVAFAPFAPRFPYESWIVPTRHEHDFGTAPAAELRDLARALQGTIRRLRSHLNDPPFSLVLHSSPLGEFVSEEYHWHIELVPRLLLDPGLEWGTGIYINPVAPEIAAERLRAAVT